ncbi:hypothetical protein JRO89_XS05G0215200 [Xanthoceras sorbifolium]|uniref:Retrovirus-related Pol polyprotein from transposon TNT 1-94-like beta-barrel domain-containing protein n=1 Tax=Xanthoceras sorbifolium TaxID=99658 RepID=A0ABQ8I2Q1_9ROSI|nr:hypothetical protein JRO89_XS05G0215200 [Xanthoceras sorbifolium]
MANPLTSVQTESPMQIHAGRSLSGQSQLVTEGKRPSVDSGGVIDSEKDCAVDDNSAVVVAIGDVRFAITAVQQTQLNGLRVKDLKVKNYLFQSIDRTIVEQILEKSTSKQIWDSMRTKFEGNASSLIVHEQKFQRHGREEYQALKVSHEERSAGRGRGKVTPGGRGRGQGRAFNKAVVECYKCHKLGHFLMFSELDKSFKQYVKLGNNMRMLVRGKGNVRLCLNGHVHVVFDVYYVPELKNNLISIGQIQERALTILIDKGKCIVYHPDKGLIIQTIIYEKHIIADLEWGDDKNETDEDNEAEVEESEERNSESSSEAEGAVNEENQAAEHSTPSQILTSEQPSQGDIEIVLDTVT